MWKQKDSLGCQIKNIPTMQLIKDESSKDLRDFLVSVKKNHWSPKVIDFDRDNFSNAILLNIVLHILDRDTRKQHELTLKDNEDSQFDDFLDFLERRCRILIRAFKNFLCKI